MRTTHIKSNVVNNGVPKLPTSDAIYYGEIAINYGASGETLSIKNSNDEIVPFSSDNAINKAFEVHAQSLIDLDGRVTKLKETKVESEEFNKIVSDLNQKLSVASESLDNLYNEIVNLTDKINENEVVISESLCDLDKRIKKIDNSYNNPTLTAITFNSITWVTDVPAKGGTATKDNCSFEVYGKYDNGISVDISSIVTVEGELVVPSSKAEQRHEAGKLTLTASYSGLTATSNVTAYQEAFDPSKEPLTFNILSAGTINWTASNSSVTKTIEYKVNNGGWTSITSDTGETAPTFNVVEGDLIQFRGNNAQYATGTSYYNSFSGSTALFEAEGNIMSLIYGDDFKNNSTISSEYAFLGLFRACTNLVSAENLILPAKTLANYCYKTMFRNCIKLTTAPALPATTLADSCYNSMFWDCTSLTTAPALPATTLAGSCYNSMFYNCTSLTTAPWLPATTLATYCYSSMFQGCTSLTTAPALPVKTLANYCYSGMFQDCTSLTTAPELPATTLATYCYSSMFQGCTSLTTAPALPVTTLANNCYQSMFNGCTKLTAAPELPATTLADRCYSQMFYNCASLTTAPALPATTLAERCYNSMFKGCTSLTTAPELPATTLIKYCYQYMFDGCTNLNYIKCLATNISASNCTNGWVSGVASVGTFVKNPDMTSWTTGVNGIPSGWAVEEYVDYTKEPLTFKISSGGTINWKASNTAITRTIDYKLNDGEWTSITSNTGSSAPTITVNSGDKLQFRGNNAQYANGSSRYNSFMGSTASFEVEGNIMSLIYGDNFKNNPTISSNFAFASLFRACANLLSAENLVLPATTLAERCYENMFYGCKSLTKAPELPATTLASGCYYSMFYNCTSLTTAPELPATTLAEECYRQMFYRCTKLNYIKCLATTISAPYCTTGWVDGVASTGTFVKPSSMTSWTTGTSGIPANWTVEDNQEPLTFNILSAGTIIWKASNTAITKTIDYKVNNGEWTSITSNTGSSAPTITVNSGDKLQFRGNNTQYATSFSNFNSFSGSTALFEAEGNIMSLIYGDDFKNRLTISSTYAFFGLFRDCAKLVSAENLILPATTLAEYCYANMFNGCTSLTTAPELPESILVNYCYNSMFAGCKSLTAAPALPATALAHGCYQNMFYGCTSLTTAPALPATTLAIDCYGNMFDSCTSLTTAPELPATDLVDYCYFQMFMGCTSLDYIKCLATDISASACTEGWVDGVASTGTFVQNRDMTSWTTGTSGVPENWAVQDA